MLSQEVYSFGELLTDEIRSIASQGGYAWLYELLLLVNKGEVARWNEAKELYHSFMMNDVCGKKSGLIGRLASKERSISWMRR